MNQYQLLDKSRNIKSRFVQKFNTRELVSIRDICSVLNAKIPAGVDAEKKLPMICCFEGVFVSDCLFIHYDRDDDSVAEQAMARGSRALLCSHQINDYPCIIVDDVLHSLNVILKTFFSTDIPATVITGSVGKTTTKNYINCVYETYYRTFCNITNGNTFEYVGFELQRIDRKAERFVQEVNESDPGNTFNSSEVLKPQIACITNMDKSHIGELGSEENIMRSICDITAGMDENGYVILNSDDKNSMKCSFKQNVITVGIYNDADCKAENILKKSSGIEFDINYEGETYRIDLPAGGDHNIYDAQMAFVAGRLNNIPVEKIIDGLQKYRPLGFRQNIYTVGNTTIYADCYNASAKSIHFALDAINHIEVKNNGKKVAVIGDISEIDGFKEDIYADIANDIDKSNIDILITFGEDSRMIVPNMKNRSIISCHETSMDGLVTRIKTIASDGDVILFKGSRTMHLENAIRKVYPKAYIRGMAPVIFKYAKWTMKTL